MGTGSLIIPGLSKLRDVIVVEGVTINLISVSQLCDKDLFVEFTKDKCMVLDRDQCQIMEGSMSFLPLHECSSIA